MLKDYELFEFAGEEEGGKNFVPIGWVDCFTPWSQNHQPGIKGIVRTKSGSTMMTRDTPEELAQKFRKAVEKGHGAHHG